MGLMELAFLLPVLTIAGITLSFEFCLWILFVRHARAISVSPKAPHRTVGLLPIQRLRLFVTLHTIILLIVALLPCILLW